MVFEFIKHNEISDANLTEISILKAEHWDYPVSEQLNWMKINLHSLDIHLLLKEDDILVGYLSMVNLDLNLDDVAQKFLGIGSVSVTKKLQKRKLGFLLMKITEYYLHKNNINGILFCKESVLSFYKKCGWNLYYGEALVENENFENMILTNKEIDCNLLQVSKYF